MKRWPIQDGRRLTERSKTYDSAGDWLWSQFEQLISLFLCFWEGQRLVEYGQAIDPQNLPLSGHQLSQKARTFGLVPAPPFLNKHNGFQCTVPSDIKRCTPHSGGGGSEAKSPTFCELLQFIKFLLEGIIAESHCML